MTGPAFCTILARNYLPKALALAESLQRHGSTEPLTVFVTDASPEDALPEHPGVRYLPPALLDLPPRTVLDLAMSYDLVEFATAVKPLVLQQLLDEYEQVFYLDPDTFVTSPLGELGPALAASPSGLLLTPHYLAPVPAGSPFTEGHLLAVGVYNLGFCGVDRRADGFLRWWWEHLRSECLHDAVAGLFVDQKWVDVGAVLFDATPLKHSGYNVSVANLHERPVGCDDRGYVIASTGEPLRLFHFHAFDTARPDELSTRLNESTASIRSDNVALDDLCREYAAVLVEKEKLAGPPPAYRFAFDSSGRRITRRMRHAYRAAVQSGADVPSPFLTADAAAWTAWRRRSAPLVGRLMLSDLAKGVRCALPEEYDDLKRRLPGLAAQFRSRVVEDSGMWH
jgi:hypothetical protein